MTAQDYSLAGKRVWVAGHRGMVGGALMRRLGNEGCTLVTVDRDQVDLRRQADVERWMQQAQPQAVFVAAATVGGILANDTHPASFLYDNLAIETNVIEAARSIGVEKLLFLGSSCIYPRLAEQPIAEHALLTGALEPTNQWYAVAKIAGIMLCRAYRRQHGCNFISAMPTNIYGPGDNFDLRSSHVVPALIAKAYAAKASGSREMPVWGSGRPRRELMYVDDVADAIVYLMQNYAGEEHVNVGVGYDATVGEIATLIARIAGFEPQLRFDTAMPDGAPQKLLDSSRLKALGWRPRTSLEDGLRRTCDWYVNNVATGVRQSGPARARS
jgi:GDP-L-fucose synthase